MKVLFVGLGSISSKHIKDLSEIAKERGMECDIAVLRRKIGDIPEELKPFGIRQIAEPDGTVYDAAFITNPTNLHYAVLEQLKGSAKFFFIEKPIFERTGYDWQSLGISGANAYIAAPMRHSLTYKKLKEIADSNRVFSARIICSSYLPEWRPNIDYRKNYSAIKALGGGVTLDLIHELDYMAGLFGMPEKVVNIRGHYSNLEIDSDDLSVYIAQYADKLCEVHLDYFGRTYQRTCELYTAQGTFIADFGKNWIIQPDGTEIDCAGDGKTNLYAEMEYFLDFVEGKAEMNLNPPEHAVEVLKITLGEN